MWDNSRPLKKTFAQQLTRRLSFIGIPNIAIIFVTLQGLGFLMVMANPAWQLQLALIPEAVRAGEYWRLVTFLSLPLAQSPLFMIFALWFLYFVLNTIEGVWGDFKTTLYTLVSILVTIAYSFAFDYPVFDIHHFESSLFFAAAALFPEMEVSIFGIIPVKMKWLAGLTAVFVFVELFHGTWLDRFFIVAIYSNFLLFFGPAVIDRARNWLRRKKFQRSLRD
jgi:membrane associated rhomboid family serine protease